MDDATQNLIDEIKDLIRQYRSEVGGGGGKAWPKSIKDRVLQLHEQGLSCKQIGQVTGISYHTALNWRHQLGRVQKKSLRGKKSKFHALTVTGQVRAEKGKNVEPTRTVTVQVEGVGQVSVPDIRSAAELIIYLKRAGG